MATREGRQVVSKPSVSQATGPTYSNGLFTLVSATEFPNFPELTWLIDDVLPSSGLASVFGPSGVGKSFVCLDMAAAIASGADWFGHVTEQCRVVYVVLEGQAGFRRRVTAWETHHGKPFPDNVRFVFDPFAFTAVNHSRKLGELITQCGGAGLVIIDTLNKSAPGTDENSSSDMGKILAGASELQEATGGMTLLVHHPGKDASRGLRGHSSLHAALDTVIEVVRDEELIRWKLVKCKDGEDGLTHVFNLSVVDIGSDKAGKAIKSCVVTEVEGGYVPRRIRRPKGANQQAILDAVRAILVPQRIQCAFENPDWPNGSVEGMPLDDVVTRIKDTLETVSTKHRQLRTREALDSLIENDFLVVRDGLLALPLNLSRSSASTDNDG